MKFEIKNRDAAGRICLFTSKHGKVQTPNLMPVINPNKMIISPEEMNRLFGTEIVITNSYIIYKDRKLRKKAIENGVHKLIKFNGTVMTDSGTFQSYVYGDVKLDPYEIVKFQCEIGSDIGTILDVFGLPNQSLIEAENGVNETVLRAKNSIKHKGEMNLALTVQGSIYPILRRNCAKRLSKLKGDYFPIGGIVPLMENQRYSDLIRIIINSKMGLDPSKPVHLFGAGHPMIFPICVALGCDLFDSSAYIKFAIDGRMIFPWGTEKLEEIEEIPCNCPICSKYSVNDLKKMEKNERISLLAKHNLYVSFTEIKNIRNAIKNGCLWELVERRACSNPYLLESLRVLRNKEHKDWLEKFEPISKKRALFYTGNQTIHRPLIYRYHNRLLSRYKSSFRKIFVLPEGKKPYSNYFSNNIFNLLKENNKSNFIVKSSIGPVPIELDEMYPLAQSIFPSILDTETEEYSLDIFDRFTKNKDLLFLDLKDNFEKLITKDEKLIFLLDLRKISAVVNMQFGKNVSKFLIKGDIEILKSKKTGKIRNIFYDNNHILSLRASDGLFTLKLYGAKILHKSLKFPKLRVIVDSVSAPFIKDGKSVFSKFVLDADPDLRPFDECLIVTEDDELIAVGKCLMNKIEMLSFDYGVAVKTREHIS